jgi:hypothetical protein
MSQLVKPYPSVHADPIKDSEADFQKFAVPALIKAGFKNEVVQTSLRRVQWGKNYGTYTVRLTNPPVPDATTELDIQIHKIWKGIVVPERIVVTAYVQRPGTGPLLSCGITTLNKLALAFRTSNAVFMQDNRYDKHQFLCIPFNKV